MVQATERGVSRHGLEHHGIRPGDRVHWNQTPPALYEETIRRGDGQLAYGGPLSVATGEYTGRSPKDKFIVRDENTQAAVWWGGNSPMEPEAFERLHADFIAHAAERDLFVQDLVGGADPVQNLPVRVVTELAWHSLFIRTLLIRPEASELESFVPEMTIIDLPSFRADPARHGTRSETVIAIDLTRLIVLVGGSAYAGEMKKAVFTALNHLLPSRAVMPMH